MSYIDKYHSYYPVPHHFNFARVLSALYQSIEIDPWDPYELESLMKGLAERTCMTADEVKKIMLAATEAWKTCKDQDVRADEIEIIRSEAAETYEEEGIIEINPNAEVIEVSGEDDGQPGAWVQAWVWMEADRPNAQCIECGEDLYPLTDGRCRNCIDKEKERDKRLSAQ